jgi:lipoprotein-releasing system permease protein
MSKLPFELLLALRYLRPKRTFVSIITLISVLGVTLGVAVLIIVISVMSGFDKELRDRMFGFNAHLKVLARDKTIENWAELSRTIAENPHVKGVAPLVLEQVMIKTQPATGQPQVLAPWVRGVDTNSEGSVSRILQSLTNGTFDVADRGMIVGTVMAANMGLQIGDRVLVYSPTEMEKMEESLRKTNQVAILAPEYTIRGIFDAGYYEFNASMVLTSLEDAQELYRLDETDSVHGLNVSLDNPDNATAAADEINRRIGPAFAVTTWMEDNPLMAAVMVEKNVMLYIMFFIVIVAAFGITCTLITFIMMKTREIGMMKALGATRRQVMSVFLGQSLIVSVAGILIGLTSGLLLIHYRNPFLHMMRRLTGLQLFPADIYGFSELPALILPRDVAIICGGSLIICLLAAAFPAWHASKLNPVEALRRE